MHKWLRTSKKGNVRLQKGARAANGLTGTHTQWMEARTDTHTHTQSWKNHLAHTPSPGRTARTGTHTHTPSPGRIARTGAHTQDWHTHTHTPQSMDGSQDWHTHTHTPSPGRTARTGTHTHTQDWDLLRACTNGCGQVKRATHGCKRAPELQMVCRFAAGMQKWLRASLPKQAEGKGSRKNTYSALLKLRVESVKGRQNLKGYGMLREAAAKSSGKGCGFE